MKQRHQLSILAFALLQAACGGGGGGSNVTSSPAGTSIIGSVPGTLIEAFGDNGSYYVVQSNDNGTAQHPFELDIPPGLGIRLVMITGEGTADEVITPIGFRDSTGNIRTRLALGEGDVVDLGHVPLFMGRNAAAMDDLDNDGVLDRPMVLDDVGAQNPLSQSDVDEDGVDDWNDDDHGGYQYDSSTRDPQDDDEDGIPNVYDHDHAGREDDSDSDGLPDHIDANPHNDEDHDNDGLDDDCDGDGYNDEDRDHDGFHDDDDDRDGFHDDDLDHDGRHDDEDDDTGTCPTPTTTTTGQTTTTTTSQTTTTTAPQTTSTTTGASTTTTTGASTTSTTMGAPTTTTTTGASTTSTTTGATTTTTTTAAPSTTTTTLVPIGSFAAGQAQYDAECSDCHGAGSHDTSNGVKNLKGTGSKLVPVLGDIAFMNNIVLSSQEILDLRAFLDSPLI